MRKWILFSALVFLLILFLSCQKQTNEDVSEYENPQQSEKMTPVAQSLDRTIDMAVVNFQKGEVAKGVGLLLDGILLVKPRENWPEGFVNTVSAANEQFQNGNMSKFGESISNALALIQPAQTDPGEEVEDDSMTADAEQREIGPAPIAQIFAHMISSANEKFKKGDADAGVIKILEALQLMTPRTQ